MMKMYLQDKKGSFEEVFQFNKEEIMKSKEVFMVEIIVIILF
jgi:hypothetical protein